MSMIIAINAKFEKVISYFKLNGYSQKLRYGQVNHTREITGSNPVSPISPRILTDGLLFFNADFFDQPKGDA